MRIICKLLLLSIFFMSLFSCEKIVDIDLRSIEPRLVIDASITEFSPCVVLLTKTQAFRDNGPSEKISGAVIELSDEDGYTEILKESRGNPGAYTSLVQGVANKKYFLKVKVGDDVYEASATIPEVIHIEEAYIYEIKAGSGSWYSPSFIFQDPEGIANYYYTILYVNGNPMKSIYLDSDEFRDGLRIHKILFFNRSDNHDNDLETGDNIKIEFQSLDKGMYTYYKSLFSVAADGGTNPLTNFSRNVLGCFKAFNTSFIEYNVSGDIIYPGN
ncbi:DUF4249 domain-containing protein [Dysgonomonas sp. Marseille-P4677]|uniref:DUF4249 domain-containing protein n=1 Tax=Dysgonomonas sp. Marseille-P4677 TaxID=2364790 RepID=UPI00191424C2|nr:DUF4249 domain-containing protein [Dysgonomonas sp. Marseille-P4677]MBK5719656.1 DUF4249 domain-containing protein [Dysgonomonas sp. Marseille-P4677]